MKHILPFILLLTCTLAPAGEVKRIHESLHGPQPEYTPPSKNPRPYVPHDVTEIGLERTGCFGFCPTYSVLINAETGAFRYHGEAHVKRIGAWTGRVRTGELEYLCYFLRESGYMEMDAIHTTSATDLPTVYTTAVIGGTRKAVSNYGSTGPWTLWAIEQIIDKLLLEAEWDPQAAGGPKMD
jgi:hypothetical protein